MYLRIFILIAAALLITLETVFLPCDYVNQTVPSAPDAGYHTMAHFNNEMILDLDALVYEIFFTILAAVIALILTRGVARKSCKRTAPRTWRTEKLTK
ncbi:MAG: hypothetical protein WCD79_11180 [Chthoniobacteraceae bacterium]